MIDSGSNGKRKDQVGTEREWPSVGRPDPAWHRSAHHFGIAWKVKFMFQSEDEGGNAVRGVDSCIHPTIVPNFNLWLAICIGVYFQLCNRHNIFYHLRRTARNPMEGIIQLTSARQSRLQALSLPQHLRTHSRHHATFIRLFALFGLGLQFLWLGFLSPSLTVTRDAICKTVFTSPTMGLHWGSRYMSGDRPSLRKRVS